MINLTIVIVAFLFLYWVDLTHRWFRDYNNSNTSPYAFLSSFQRVTKSTTATHQVQRTGYDKETLLIDTTILRKKSLGSGSYATFYEF